jgi:hypothetical protein
LSPSFFLGGGKIDGLFSAMEIVAAAKGAGAQAKITLEGAPSKLRLGGAFSAAVRIFKLQKDSSSFQLLCRPLGIDFDCTHLPNRVRPHYRSPFLET